jgi:hypothetical protein
MPEIEKHTAVLREVANFLRSLTDEQVGQLERGEARIVLGRRNTSTRKNRVSQEQSIDLADVRASLQEMDNRDEGQAFLDGLRLSKLELQELAGSLDMPVSKSDTVGKLKDLVIEATIGFRLRSNAIRGVRSVAPQRGAEN